MNYNIIIASYQQPDFPEKRTHHFSKNLDKRPGESSIRKGFRYKSRDDRPNSPKSGMWIFKTSNGSKIARIAPISTIFGRNRSRRPELFFFRNFRAVEKNFASTKKSRRANDGDIGIPEGKPSSNFVALVAGLLGWVVSLPPVLQSGKKGKMEKCMKIKRSATNQGIIQQLSQTGYQ